MEVGQSEDGSGSLSELGAGGGCKAATIRGTTAALKHFGNFLLYTKLIIEEELTSMSWIKKAEGMEEALCKESLFRKYGTYLIKVAKKADDLTPLEAATGSQYFSASKVFVQKLFPKNPLWIDHSSVAGCLDTERWFSDVYRLIETGLTDLHRVMEIESDEGIVMGREVLAEGVSYLFRQNTHRSIESAVEAVATAVHVARGNEPSFASFSACQWNTVEDNLDLDWFDEKCSTIYTMKQYPDRNKWQLDMYFMMFSYILVGGGMAYTCRSDFVHVIDARKVHGKSHLMFPSMAVNGSQQVTQTLKKLVGKIDGLPNGSKVYARSLRYGMYQEVVINEHAGRDPADFIGGWTNPKQNPLHTSNTYLQRCEPLLMIGARAVQGHINPRRRVFPPKLLPSMIAEGEQDRICQFLKELL